MNAKTHVTQSGRSPLPAAIETAAADWVTRADAGLTREEQQIFQDWLSGDPRHADAFDRFTEAWSVFDRVQERGAASVILDQLAVRTRQRKARRVQAGVAAGLALAAGLFYFQWRVAAPGRGLPTQPSAVAQVAPAPAYDPIRKLPDGSIVELNAGAEIEVRYSATERRVKLVKGEAFFRVEKNKDRPFYVESNGVVVRAVGTAFAVQMQPTAVEVVVKEGAVDVGRISATGTTDGNPVRVEAGKKVRFALIRLRPAIARTVNGPVPAEAEALSQPQEMNDDQMNARLAWRLPRLEFEGMALAEAVALMNRHNRLQLRIEGKGFGEFRVTGNYRSDNPEGFVRMLEEIEVATSVRNGDGEIVLRPAK
ncbi:MAG: FecR domain-containing protein [bacterium]|nr:FecR domain-containing protein [bacterium]MDI1336939.1 FecR domain-containing protein [Lacunisphaera sp.]